MMSSVEGERIKELYTVREHLAQAVDAAWDVVFHEPVDIGTLTKLECFTIDFYKMLKKTDVVGSFVRHDLGPVANGALGYVSMLSEGMDDPDIRAQAATLTQEYILVLRDILLRLDDTLGIVEMPEQRQLEANTVMQLISALSQSLDNEVNATLDMSDIHAVNTEGLYLSGRQAAMVYNGIRNIMTNAVKKEIGATTVVVSCELEADHLRYTIEDNGIGMKSGRLDDESELFIFKKGVSGRGSTGLGLAELDTRLEEEGILLAVASNDQTYSNGDATLVPPDTGSVFHIDIPLSR